jgi:hypothetical protein
MPGASRIVVRDTPVDLLRDGSGPPLLSHEATLAMMQMFAEEVMPAFREDAAVDETVGIGR